MNMKIGARQRWRKHRCPHCKLRQSKRSGSPCPNDIIKVCICCDFCRRDCALDAATTFLRQEQKDLRELTPPPAPGRTPSPPPPWSQTPRKRPRTRKQYLPASPPIVTPGDRSPPGYPRLLASARREPIEPAQWPPSPTIRGDAGFSLDARRGRDQIT